MFENAIPYIGGLAGSLAGVYGSTITNAISHCYVNAEFELNNCKMSKVGVLLGECRDTVITNCYYLKAFDSLFGDTSGAYDSDFYEDIIEEITAEEFVNGTLCSKLECHIAVDAWPLNVQECFLCGYKKYPHISIDKIDGTVIQNATVGTYTLPSKVIPSDATYKDIIWTVVSGNASVSGNTLSLKAAGKVVIKATVKKGGLYENDWSETYEINCFDRQAYKLSEGYIDIEKNGDSQIKITQTILSPWSEKVYYQSATEPVWIEGKVDADDLSYISVKDGASPTIIIDNINFVSPVSLLEIESGAKVNLNLTGNNVVKSQNVGIYVPEGASLTIEGTGSLDIIGGYNGFSYPAIGANNVIYNCGSITVNSGTITATVDRNNSMSATIGGYDWGHGGSITINGGSVTATARGYGTAIGGGYQANGGNITINGGTVIAVNDEKNYAGSAIGNGWGSNGGTIKINGGFVEAVSKGALGDFGLGGNGATVTISGGTVFASENSRYTSDAIGGTVVVTGGNVKAVQTENAITDGKNVLVLHEITLAGAQAQTAVTRLDGASGYGLLDVQTLDTNKLYVYLPENTNITGVVADGVEYKCKNGNTYNTHSSDSAEYENGFCVICGGYQPAKLNASGVYEISNPGQLYWLAQQIPQMSDEFHAKLTADITFPEDIPWTTVWVPENISTDSILDGDGHTLNIGSQSGGIFSSFNYGIIKNMIVRGSITADGGNVGALAGSAYRTQFQNIISYVDVTNETGNAGGLVGYYGGKHADGRYSRIENCAVYADITGNNAGGLVGEGWNGTQYYDITNSVYVGDVTGSSAAGAIVGYQNTDSNTSRFTNIYWCETDGLDFYGKRDTTNQVYTQTEAKTVEQFASGEVAYLLGEAFGQTIGSDEYPLIGGDTVYQVLNCKGETAYSNANETLGHNYSDGVCTVCGEKQILRGDVNGDGRINSRDAMALKKYIGNAGGTINMDNADVNGDGRINSRDLMSLKKKLTN